MGSTGRTAFVDPMDLNALTADQSAAMKEMKQRFTNNAEPYVHDEHFLLHWLRARRFDVDKAEAMLRNHLRYRKAMNMDSPAYKNFSVSPIMGQYYTRGEIGHDKHGHPIAYFPFGGIDAKGLLSSVRHSEGVHTIMYWLENRRWACQEAAKKTGHHVSQILYIIDLKGIGVKHLWMPGIEVFKQISEAVQIHTPEMINKFFILNAPNVFYTIFKMLKPVLDENIQRKINIFGENFQEALLKEIDADQLPAYYGGTLVGPDGDPRCSHAIRYGGDVPPEMYFKDTISPPDSELQSLTIGRGNKTLIPVISPKPMTQLKWYFRNEASNDVGFGIYRKVNEAENDPDKMEMVIPYFRLFTALVPEWGEVILKEPGTYVVLFDNTYSWVQNKYVKYRLILQEMNQTVN